MRERERGGVQSKKMGKSTEREGKIRERKREGHRKTERIERVQRK